MFALRIFMLKVIVLTICCCFSLQCAEKKECTTDSPIASVSNANSKLQRMLEFLLALCATKAPKSLKSGHNK